MRTLMTLMLVLAASGAQAKELFVNAAIGNDAVTYAANSATNPWRSLGRALWGSTNREARNGAEAAKAGDVVSVTGDQTAPGNVGRWDIAFFSENSGTVGMPIIYRAIGKVALTRTAGAGPIVGCDGRNYLIWDGFTANESATNPSSPDTGPALIHESQNGCAFMNMEITGNGVGTGNLNSDPDNHPGLRIEAAKNYIIRDSYIHNVQTRQTQPHNGACIQTYAQGNGLIENNDLADCGAGVFIKGGPNSFPDTGVVIQRNRIWGIREGGSGVALHAGANGTAAHPIVVRNNIISGFNGFGITFWKFSDTDVNNTPMWVQAENNTVVGTRSCLFYNQQPTVQTHHTFKRNVCAQQSFVGYEWDAPTASPKSMIDADANVITAAITATVTSGANFAGLAWRTASGQDATSTNADPLFVSSADFHLQAGSPARALGAGAYVTGAEQIGRRTGVVTPPPAPVDCVLSAPTTTTGPLVPLACPATGVQSRTDTWLRTIVTPASNGGAACGPTTGTTTTTVSCTYVPPVPTTPVLDCSRIVSTVGGTPVAGEPVWTIRLCAERPQR